MGRGNEGAKPRAGRETFARWGGSNKPRDFKEDWDNAESLNSSAPDMGGGSSEYAGAARRPSDGAPPHWEHADHGPTWDPNKEERAIRVERYRERAAALEAYWHRPASEAGDSTIFDKEVTDVDLS